MPDRRIAKANAHALTLLRDLNELTLSSLPDVEKALWQDDLDALLTPESATDLYLIGFEDHLPIGYILYHPLDLAVELRGPFLYPEYRDSDAGVFLVEQARRLAQANDLFVLIALAPKSLVWCESIFTAADFDEISCDSEFIRRWNDGLLADYPLSGNERLLGQLLESTGKSDDRCAAE